MNPILSRRTLREIVVAEIRERFAVDDDRARGRPVEAADRFSSVDLPEPEGPMIETISPRGIVRLSVRAP